MMETPQETMGFPHFFLCLPFVMQRIPRPPGVSRVLGPGETCQKLMRFSWHCIELQCIALQYIHYLTLPLPLPLPLPLHPCLYPYICPYPYPYPYHTYLHTLHTYINTLHVYICTYIYIYIYIYIHIYTYIYIYIHIYTYIR